MAGICKVIIVFYIPVVLLWQVSAKLLLCFTLPYFFCGRYLQSYYCVLHPRNSSVAGICKVIIVFYIPVLLLWQVSAKLLLCFTLPYFFCGRYLQSYYCVLHSRTSSVAGICKVIIVFYIPVLLLWQVSAKLLLCFTFPYFFCGRYLQSYYCVLHSRTSSVAGICKVIIVFFIPVLLLWQVSAKLLLCFTFPYFFCGRYLQSFYCVLHSRTSSVAGTCKVIIVFYTPVLLLWQVSAKLLLCFTLPYFFCGRYLQSYYCVLHSRTSSVAGICKVITVFYIPPGSVTSHSRTSSVAGICKVITVFYIPPGSVTSHSRTSSVAGICKVIIVFYTPVLLLWQVSAKLLLSFTFLCNVIVVCIAKCRINSLRNLKALIKTLGLLSPKIKQFVHTPKTYFSVCWVTCIALKYYNVGRI